MKKQSIKITKFARLACRIIYSGFNSFGLNRLDTVVLSYHGFSKNNENRYTIDPLKFEKQVEKIKKYSKFINIDQLFIDRGNKQSSILMTIDDGYRDVFNVVPLIKKYKIPVVLFVLSDPKHAKKSELDHNGKLLSWKDIKYLHSLGFTIGCHSATHADFNKLSKKEIDYEVVISKKVLEKKLGFKIDYFAYPKGVFNKQVVDAVKKAGYKWAFAVGPGSIDKKTNRFVIPRIVIDREYSLNDFPSVYSQTTLFMRNAIDKFGFLKG